MLTVALAVALGVAVLTAAELGRRLRCARRELAALREQSAPIRPTRAMQVAGLAVRTVVDSAAQMRRHGVAEFLMGSIQDFTQWSTEERAEIAGAATPAGIVTIFFSDIESSTELNERLGDRDWVRLLREHDRVVRAAVEQHHGHVVKTQGDGFMVVFGEPSDGVRAAVAIQTALADGGGRRLRRDPVRVRIGMHVGKTTSRDGDYFGRNVAMAARVAAQAEGAQILVTDELRARLGDLDDVRLVQGDEVELKGLTGTHQLWSVEPV